MTGEEYDELIDSLPLHLRNKVLGHGQEAQPQGKKVGKPHSFLFFIVFFLAVLWAIPWVLLGALICIPIVTIPYGFAVMVFGCLPASTVVALHAKRKARYADSRRDWSA